MDIKKIFGYLAAHPIVLAIIIFAGLFLWFQVVHKSSGATTATPPPTTPPSTLPPQVYNQTYNSYPTTPAPPNPPPKPHQAIFANFLGPSGEKVYLTSYVNSIQTTRKWEGGIDQHGQRWWFSAPGITQGLFYPALP